MSSKVRWIVLLIIFVSESALSQVVAQSSKTPSSVLAEGVGKTDDEALRAAFREAVSKVVGKIISAKTVVKNDEIIAEEILEFSGGFISTYEVLSRAEANGLIRIKISAIVDHLQVTKRLKKSLGSGVNVSGEDLIAEKLTKEDARKNAAKLLRSQLAEIPNLFVAKATAKPKLAKDGKGIEVPVEISIDAQKYAEFTKTIVPLLEKLAIEKSSGWVSGSESRGFYGSRIASQLNHFMTPRDHWPQGTAIWILSTMGGTSSKHTWQYFFVDTEFDDPATPILGTPIVRIQVHDRFGKRIATEQFRMVRSANEKCVWMLQTEVESLRTDKVDSRSLLIAPFAFDSDMRQFDRVLKWNRRIDLADSEIEQIARVEVSVVVTPQKVK